MIGARHPRLNESAKQWNHIEERRVVYDTIRTTLRPWKKQSVRGAKWNTNTSDWLIDWLIDNLTLADCNNPARGQKQGNIRINNEQETEEKTNKQSEYDDTEIYSVSKISDCWITTTTLLEMYRMGRHWRRFTLQKNNQREAKLVTITSTTQAKPVGISLKPHPVHGAEVEAGRVRENGQHSITLYKPLRVVFQSNHRRPRSC